MSWPCLQACVIGFDGWGPTSCTRQPQLEMTRPHVSLVPKSNHVSSHRPRFTVRHQGWNGWRSHRRPLPSFSQHCCCTLPQQATASRVSNPDCTFQPRSCTLPGRAHPFGVLQQGVARARKVHQLGVHQGQDGLYLHSIRPYRYLK